MRPDDILDCPDFPCRDVDHTRFTLPDAEIDPEAIRVVLVAEAPPTDPADWFFAPGEPFFWQTTRRALADAGLDIADPRDLAGLGIHLTTAIKCAKQGYGASAATVAACAERILHAELALFPNTEVIVLLGDVAIKSINTIARRRGGKRVVPSGSTYKIRGAYDWDGITVYPSYLTTGKSYLIEGSKRGMVAEDLRAALAAAGIASRGNAG